MDGYSRGGHSKYGMKVHLIFVTKYRKKIFKSDKYANDAKQFLYDTAKRYCYRIIQMETDKDHVLYCLSCFTISETDTFGLYSSNIVHIKCGIITKHI